MGRPKWAAAQLETETRCLRALGKTMEQLLRTPVRIFWRDPEDPLNCSVFITTPYLVEIGDKGLELHLHRGAELAMGSILEPLELVFNLKGINWGLSYNIHHALEKKEIPEFTEVEVDFL